MAFAVSSRTCTIRPTWTQHARTPATAVNAFVRSSSQSARMCSNRGVVAAGSPGLAQKMHPCQSVKNQKAKLISAHAPIEKAGRQEPTLVTRHSPAQRTVAVAGVAATTFLASCTPALATSSASSGSGVAAAVSVGALAALAAVYVASKANDASSEPETSEVSEPVTVAKVQVCMLASARQLKQELDQMCSDADTGTEKGLQAMVSEVVLALLRYPEYCVSAATTSSNEKNIEDGEAAFNIMSLEERSHYKVETLNNTSGKRVRKAKLAKESTKVSEVMVVSIMVAADGKWSLPTIRNMSDLKVALQKVGSIPSNQLLAAEITWTPQTDNDSLTRQEVQAEYPNLVQL